MTPLASISATTDSGAVTNMRTPAATFFPSMASAISVNSWAESCGALNTTMSGCAKSAS
ncbi:Uncharacterised protein [Bordetella pertussis]|nr:Uncharacterised protein [Bordetella pertussis]